jgi:drug/metabolite transporter (DMT)-like permease
VEAPLFCFTTTFNNHYLCSMTNTRRAHFSLLLSTLIFGLHYSIAKSLMPGFFSPAQLIFLRSLGGVITFWLFQRMFVHEKVEKRDLLKLALCGLLGFALNQTFFYEGLNLTSPVDASLIHVMNPILVLIFAHLLIREKVTWTKATGIATGAIGATILILYGRALDFGADRTIGNILVFLNMVFYALYLIIIKPLTTKYHSSTILKWVSLFGFLFIVPYTIKPAMEINFSAITLQAYLSLAYVIIINTFLAYLLVNFALKHLTASTVSYYNYLQPFIAAVLTISIGQDIITWPKVIAALLIFTGVYIVNKSNYEKRGT